MGPTRLAWEYLGPATHYQVQVTPHIYDGPGVNLIIGDAAKVQSQTFILEPPRLGQGMYVLLPWMTYNWRVRISNAPAAVPENDPSWSAWSEMGRFFTPETSSAGEASVGPPDGTSVDGRSGVTL